MRWPQRDQIWRAGYDCAMEEEGVEWEKEGEAMEREALLSSSILIATWFPVAEKEGAGGCDTSIIHTN
jgi:hypothetical protein